MEQTIQQRIADIQRGDIPAGYRKTKLGIIPADWSTPELNSVLTENKERNRSGRFGKEDVLSVSGEFGVTNQIELLGRSFAGASVKDYHIVEAGNIVYTKSPLKDNPYGIIKLNKGNAGIVSTLYAVYCCKSNEVGTYLDYYFSLDQNVNNYLRPLVRKGTKNDMKINNGDVLKGCVILPPESETAKIVEILGCCDRVIALKKELIAEKKKQKKALMQKLLNPDSGFRLPGFSGEWKKTTIGESGTFVKGKGIQNSQCTSVGFPCVKYGDIYMKYNISFNAAQSFTSESVFSESLQITSGALLFTCSGEDPLEIGKCVLYSGSDYIAVGGDIIVMHPNESISPDFLVHQQYSDDLIKQKSALGKGNSIVHIHLPEIKSLKISLPPTIKEQQAIADILSAADKEIDLLEQELVQQEQKKKSLMQLLLTGIVRV